jgi:hypothetical protein
METTNLAVREDILEIDPPRPSSELAQTGVDEHAAPREKGKRYLCRHIFVDGRRCGSPALREENFCYFHRTHRTPVLANARRNRPRSGFDLTLLDGLDNHAAIQLSITEVLGRIARNEIEPKSAWLLLYGLQIAGTNLRRSRTNEEAPLAEHIVDDSVHGQLAEPEPGRFVEPDPLKQMIAILRENPDPPIPDVIPPGLESFYEDIRQQKLERGT